MTAWTFVLHMAHTCFTLAGSYHWLVYLHTLDPYYGC